MTYIVVTFVSLAAVCIWHQVTSPVRLPPTITIQNDELVKVLPEDTKIMLFCEATGEPTPEYEWLFNGGTLDFNNAAIKTFLGVGTIEVTLTPMQEGSYQCFANNRYGRTMTDISYLIRAVLPAFPPGPDQDYIVYESDPLVVSCRSTKSILEAVYSWEIVESREGIHSRVVNLDRRVQQDDRGNLYFSTVRKTDEQDGKLYRCVTINRDYRVARFGSYSKIQVTERPDRSIAPRIMFYTGQYTMTSVIAIKRKDLRLQCLFSGNPVPTVSWRKKYDVLPNGRYSYENFDTTLVISDVTDVDEGIFTCSGNNNQESRTQDIRVEVESIPEFVSEDDMPRNLNVTQGKDAIFRCASVAEPVADITWYINGREVTEINKPERVIFEDESRTLKVQDTCKDCETPPSDLKVYQCNSSNIHGYKFAAGYLNVLLPTTLAKAPEDVEMVYGEDVRFECRGSSDDSTPIIITWTKNHSRVITPKEGRISFEDNGAVLIIDKDELLEEDVEGDYTCIVTNGYSTVNATASLTRPAESIPTDAPGGRDVDITTIVSVVVIVFIVVAVVITVVLLVRKRKAHNAQNRLKIEVHMYENQPVPNAGQPAPPNPVEAQYQGLDATTREPNAGKHGSPNQTFDPVEYEEVPAAWEAQYQGLDATTREPNAGQHGSPNQTSDPVEYEEVPAAWEAQYQLLDDTTRARPTPNDT